MELMNKRLINKMAIKTDLEDVKEKVIEIMNKTRNNKVYNKKMIKAISTMSQNKSK